MAMLFHRFTGRILQRLTRRRWQRAAHNAPTARQSLLRQQLSQARQFLPALQDLIYTAENRLVLPLIGSKSFPRPGGTDWSWRPELWCGPLGNKGIASAHNKTSIGTEVTLFHNCNFNELTLRQIRNTRAVDLAAYGLRLDVFRFGGSFLSLVLDLPKEATQGLGRRHIIRVSAIIELEKPLDIFARLNVQHGPNTEQITIEVPVNDRESVVEFDLGYSELNEKRIENAWLDLLFEGPEMNEVTIRDVTICRYPRAEL